MLDSSETEFMLEAHNGLSARIAEEAGFRGIWASGLTIAAQHGVRDNNELSWTQVVETVEFMTDVTTIPILLDGDTGYGDFNNMRRLVRKLERSDVAGVCIEDKLFPKSNSFVPSEREPLAGIAEFAGKIRAGKDSQDDPDFSIVARVEALVAGWGMEEALRRAEAYREAGADAILIHSKRAHPDEVLAFAGLWQNRCPLLVVPTKYYGTPAEVFRRAGISLVIWANHLLRASVAAMQQVAAAIGETQSLVEAERRIAPMAEIFRLQGVDELLEAEKTYMGGPSKRKAVVLAAARHEEPGLPEEGLNVAATVAGRSLLERLVAELKKQRVDDVTVVVGRPTDAVDVADVDVVIDPESPCGELACLSRAADLLGADTLVVRGDVLFRSYVLADLLSAPGALIAVVDSRTPWETAGEDFAYCSELDDRGLHEKEVLLEHVGPEPAWHGRTPCGRWAGIIRVTGEGREDLLHALDEVRRRPDFDRLGLPDLLNVLVAAGRPIRVMYINGHWLDGNNASHLRRARLAARPSSPPMSLQSGGLPE